MNKINKDLKMYIEEKILPLYEKNEKGHGIEHIENILRRSFLMAEGFKNINFDILYVVAIYHDVAHHIDKDNHEILSAEMFYCDDNMKKYFTDDERIVIKEAIEDHRANLKTEPRSIYGKLLSTADSSKSLDEVMKRTYTYTLRHFPEYSVDEIVDRAYEHIKKKYGHGGYAKVWVRDIEFEQFKDEVSYMLENKDEFREKYLKINNISE